MLFEVDLRSTIITFIFLSEAILVTIYLTQEMLNLVWEQDLVLHKSSTENLEMTQTKHGVVFSKCFVLLSFQRKKGMV
jgi:hypothetical protein